MRAHIERLAEDREPGCPSTSWAQAPKRRKTLRQVVAEPTIVDSARPLVSHPLARSIARPVLRHGRCRRSDARKSRSGGPSFARARTSDRGDSCESSVIDGLGRSTRRTGERAATRSMQSIVQGAAQQQGIVASSCWRRVTASRADMFGSTRADRCTGRWRRQGSTRAVPRPASATPSRCASFWTTSSRA